VNRRVLTPADVGRRAEDAVADFLFAAGFSLLSRNQRLGALELDVVAHKGTLIVVVEVRTRSSHCWEHALESVTRKKRQRLRRAAAALWPKAIAAQPGVTRMRLDVAAVTFAGSKVSVEYVAGALG
jgi:putative endonuclease